MISAQNTIIYNTMNIYKSFTFTVREITKEIWYTLLNVNISLVTFG